MRAATCYRRNILDQRFDLGARLLLILLIATGAAARVYDLGYPLELTWDEPHFVENARNLLEGNLSRYHRDGHAEYPAWV